jgi:methyl-accepting chemotaxis protein
MNVVTDIADQQLLSTFLIIVLVLILAVAIGVTTGRSIARPILHSVASLRDNSQSLKTLADEENVVATEQSWMVEASQVALASIKYYTNAVSVASQRIQSIGVEIGQSPSLLDEHKVNRTLQEMAAIATYIERAVKHQEAMNEKLGISLRVTTQAAEQLTKGAKSTDDAAAQLEHVVEQLISVVGSETKSVQR